MRTRRLVAPWLADFIRQPTRHLPRTIMPDLLLEPIQNRDSEGKVLSVTDPAEDIAEFLLQNPAAGYEPQPLPEIDEKTLDQLTLEYLRGAYHESKAQQYVEQGIPSQLADTLQEAEKELIVPDQSEPTASSQTGGNESKTRLSVQQKLRYVGSKAIGKYGCFGCHDIPGFETAKQIGPPLSDWGRKVTTLLAFENITAYLQAHGGGPRVAEADKDYFRQQLAAGSRIGFIYQKLAEPRSYDYQVAQNKPYSDRLRMPQFPFDAEQREAIITFVLGLVAQPPTEKYVYAPDSSRSATIEGEILLDKYRCASCHVLEPQKWRLEYAPGDFRPQPEKAVFPFVDHVFRDDELRRSQQPDARGMLHATLVGMPTLGDDGRALVFDEAGDELLEDENEKYLPTTLEYPFQLWQPAALDGHGYQVGRTAVSVRGDQVVARQRCAADSWLSTSCRAWRAWRSPPIRTPKVRKPGAGCRRDCWAREPRFGRNGCTTISWPRTPSGPPPSCGCPSTICRPPRPARWRTTLPPRTAWPTPTRPSTAATGLICSERNRLTANSRTPNRKPTAPGTPTA